MKITIEIEIEEAVRALVSHGERLNNVAVQMERAVSDTAVREWHELSTPFWVALTDAQKEELRNEYREHELPETLGTGWAE
jgi:hypothetical protein